MKPKVYVEGGGNSSLDRECRQGFSEFFKKMGLQVQFIACGPRDKAFKRFKNAVEKSDGTWPILLVDSEEVVTTPTKREHLINRDMTWQFLDSVEERQVQLMTTCMESWLVCDKQTLREYFGQCFTETSLPVISNIEDKDHHEVIKALEAATRDCGKDKGYSKGQHSFKILAKLNPQNLMGLKYFDEAHKAIKGHTPT